MFYNGGYAGKGKLEIGHMYAADVDVAAIDKTVSGIVDAKAFEDV